MDGRREAGPEEDGCHKLEDTCTQKRRLEDDREGGQGPIRTVEPWSSSSLQLKEYPEDEGIKFSRNPDKCLRDYSASPQKILFFILQKQICPYPRRRNMWENGGYLRLFLTSTTDEDEWSF